MKVLLVLMMLLAGCGREHDPVPDPIPPVTPVPRKPYVPNYPNGPQVADPEVNDLVKEFRQLCETNNNSECRSRWTKLEYVMFVDEATIRSGPDGKPDPEATNRVGVCWSWTNPNGSFNHGYVQLLDHDGHGNPWPPEQLAGLVYHELGHCLLDLGHTEVRPPEDPAMMNASLYWNQVYKDFWDPMVEEEFHQAPTLSLSLNEDDTDRLTLTIYD